MPRQRAYSETVRQVAQLLGAQIREGRIQRGWTVRQLAERAGISKDTVLKAEHGDPRVALGTALDLAVLVGVPLFADDRRQLAVESARARDRVMLLARRVRPKEDEPDYDF
jgi:transcriptional regulator with XRE-family HTH domain